MPEWNIFSLGYLKCKQCILIENMKYFLMLIYLISIKSNLKTSSRYFRDFSRVLSIGIESHFETRKFFNSFFDYYFDFKCLSFFADERITY
jgi:hypothetical protein